MQAEMTENLLEETVLYWLEELGYTILHGPDIAPGTAAAERSDYGQVLLLERLRQALTRINPQVSADGIEEALRKIQALGSPDLVDSNRAFHRLLTDGIDVELADPSAYGGVRYDKVWLLDLDKLENNDWLAVNQFTVVEEKRNRRADVVVFVNGLPLALLELKNPGDETATIKQAFQQFQTYKKEIPSLFVTNELLVISDGVQARAGTLTSGWDRYQPWRTVDGQDIAAKGLPELEVLLRGLFLPRRLLDYVLNFIVFEDDGAKLVKKSAAYHQYWAVNKAVAYTCSACGFALDETKLIGRFPPFAGARGTAAESTAVYGPGTKHFGGRRVGVIWHTQGSGKSLSMTFYAGKLVRHPDMNNPTLVVLTDRNDLDDQLFGTFAGCKDLLRQSPVQAQSRSHLRELLKVAAGGVVFTTVQKFMPDEKGDVHPLLCGRENIVVIADEAHRSQYDFIDGFARHLHDALPNASFIGFTGTPIESDDRSTKAVFGDYIDKYDILRAVEDGATVPIYYENRLVRLAVKEEAKPRIDPEFDEITEGEEESGKQALRSKWAALEALVGAEERVAEVAADFVAHWEKRLAAMDGKAMIVCMSRRICVDLYEAIRALRPDWHDADDGKGNIKIIMSGSASDHEDWQAHIRSKSGRETMAKRFKDPNDPLQVVLVRDMWLTGFDCPSMHTMYLDKPMSGHNLMQAIARVNRVFRDKPGGLVVDYLGLADSLKKALATYTESGGKGDATVDQDLAVAVMREKYEVVCDILHGFDYPAIIAGDWKRRMSGIAQAMEFILALEDGKKRYLPAVTALSKAFALAVPRPEALEIRDEVSFFQEVRAALVKTTGDETGRTPEEMEAAIKQLVSQSVASTEVVDIFAAAGLDKPDISILSDQFLDEVRQLPQRNLALELLRKLINDQIKSRARKNVVQARSFAEMLEQSVRKYQNRAIETAEIIQELINLAREMREAAQRGEGMGLSDDEVAFYDALADNGSARELMGDEKLRFLARELVDKVKKSASIDWTLRESARAQIRVTVKRLLRHYGYPPDMTLKATELVVEQAEVLCKEWVS